MLDPWFKDLSSKGYVGKALTIDIVVTYDGQFFLLTFMILYLSLQGQSNALSKVSYETICNIIVFIGMGVSKDETYFEKINLIIFITSLKDFVS
jgi:hypothetical protein